MRIIFEWGASHVSVWMCVQGELQHVAAPSPLQCEELKAFTRVFIVCFSPPEPQPPESGSLLHTLQGQVTALRSMPELVD